MDPITAANFTSAGLSLAFPDKTNPNLAEQQNATYVNGSINNMNNILNQALQNAIGTNTAYTNMATQQQNTGLNSATNALNSSLNNANTAVNNSIGQGVAQSQAINAPYSLAGMNALDSYEDSLGVARPTMGNAAYSAALGGGAQISQGIQPLLSNLANTAQAAGISNNGQLAVAPQLQQVNKQNLINSVYNTETPNQIQQWLQAQKTPGYYIQGNQIIQGYTPQEINAAKAADANYRGTMNYNAAQQQNQNQYNAQMSTYNPYATAYNVANSAANNLTPQQIQQLQVSQAGQQGLFGPVQRTNV